MIFINFLIISYCYILNRFYGKPKSNGERSGKAYVTEWQTASDKTKLCKIFPSLYENKYHINGIFYLAPGTMQAHTWQAEGTNNQIPNNKHQIANKSQIPSFKFSVDYCLLFGLWNLRFILLKPFSLILQPYTIRL